MEQIITALAFAWRTIKGRDSKPALWNVCLYSVLWLIMYGYVYFEIINKWQAVGIYAVVITYLLTGYKSFTVYWVQYLMGKITEEEYEAPDKGFSSWHMSYRYVVAGGIICAILGTFSTPYIITLSVAGSLFPLRVKYWNTEASARLTEGVLGAVLMGWIWLI